MFKWLFGSAKPKKEIADLEDLFYLKDMSLLKMTRAYVQLESDFIRYLGAIALEKGGEVFISNDFIEAMKESNPPFNVHEKLVEGGVKISVSVSE